MHAAPKGISFDAAGTLFSLAESVGETYSSHAAKVGIDVTPGALQSAFGNAFRVVSECPPQKEGAELSWWKRVVARCFIDAGTDEAILAEVFDELFDHLFSHYATTAAWRLYPEVKAVLRYCGQRASLAVLSNFDARLHGLLEEFGIAAHFDAVVISDEIGCRKPDPRMFAAAAQALTIELSTLLHIGDDPHCDWQGGLDAGCQVYRLDRSRGTLADLMQ